MTASQTQFKVSLLGQIRKIGDKGAASTLIRLLGDADKLVAESARSALVELAGGRDYGTNVAAWRAHFNQ